MKRTSVKRIKCECGREWIREIYDPVDCSGECESCPSTMQDICSGAAMEIYLIDPDTLRNHNSINCVCGRSLLFL